MTLEYVSLAVSKDETRSKLTGVYRDKTHLVATDGHRLHYSNGLPEVEPHFIDGRDCQFPDWNQVVPKDEAPTVQIAIGADQLRALKGLAAFIKSVEPKKALSRFEFSPGKLIISYARPLDGVRASLELAATCDITQTVGLQLNYFLDAITLPVKQSKHHVELATISVRNESSPLVIQTALGTAIIMPMRL